MSAYTVKQLAQLAGVTIRTLHHYDEIGLLKPSRVGANGYRYYADSDLLRLQQILFFRELECSLPDIKRILSAGDFDSVTALRAHRRALQERLVRMQALLLTVDSTIAHLTEGTPMGEKKIFEGFSEEKQKRYEAEAMRQYDPETVRQSIKLWKSYSAEQKEQIFKEGQAIYLNLAANMDKGTDSPEIQGLLGKWHQHLRHFYEPTLEILRALGENYHDHPEFNATFTAIHPDLPAFLKQAIGLYVETLENEWLDRQLGILEE